jgi:hypothetical protein
MIERTATESVVIFIIQLYIYQGVVYPTDVDFKINLTKIVSFKRTLYFSD